MFRKLGSSSSLWKPKNPHSLEYLKYLQGILVKNEKVTESNRKVLVEALRAIAEILIWGDQNDASVFDFFLERQMILNFIKIMEYGNGLLDFQLLQTLNILFENIRHDTSLYFLLSNNHVNSIISHKFDLKNDEIMAYYISFLKILSFKLTSHTIHFFFNETTNEFPLLSETLKLYDWDESMVRIAVRNIILNIVRVEDAAMLKYVKENTKLYLSELIDSLVEFSIDLDIFVRSAENVQANRDRLREKVDDLVDLIHYIGELLEVPTIAEPLSLLVKKRYLMPLLLNSFTPRRDNHALLLNPVSSLFFFSEFLIVVRHQETIHEFLSRFLFDDQTCLNSHWVRAEQSFCLKPITPPPKSSNNRVFFDSLISAFDASQNDDYVAFYGLMLIYSIFQNKADVDDILAAAKFPRPSESCAKSRNNSYRSRAVTELGVEATEEEEVFVDEKIEKQNSIDSNDSVFKESSSVDTAAKVENACDSRLIEALCSIVAGVGKNDSRIRPITLELTCLVIRQILMSIDDEHVHNKLVDLCRDVRKSLVNSLAVYVNNENSFLEWFEDEYAEFEVNHINFDIIGYEMLLPPAATPISALPLHKRLPSGFEERLRTQILFYLHIRKLERDMTGEADGDLPIRLSTNQELVAVGDCINLNNSDLLSCHIVPQKACSVGKVGEKIHRFLVTDRLQLILVEPDSRKIGWAIVRFVGLLQDTKISGDSSDSRVLHIVVEGQPSRLKKRQPVLNAKFIFDDHIRCMAAKQRLSKGRQTARTLKLHKICDVLGVPKVESPSPRMNPFRIVKGCAPGSVRKTVSTNSRSGASARSSSTVRDDPITKQCSNSRFYI